MMPAPMSKLEKLSRRILTDGEVRYLAGKLRHLMGDPLSEMLRRYGISPEDHFRFRPLALRLEAARAERGLSLKVAALALKVPQYRLAAIEGCQFHGIDAGLVVRYVEYLGLKSWFGRWRRGNAGLARRLRLAGSGNLTERPTRTRVRAARAGGR
jgi:hypothetical protein